ncbi:UDP-N-acetylmuramoyl-L-alanyl-D-glutamate--2,6-diaminopimelate ligase [Aquabacterium sp. OR-4]|uniref:UDP-N-acetylmuramoyl-L-alanyl-D-glutamate--2, 6-diaminopimelate ligase n=1 Tax=Aquabacterium sp. OR-4 TaxID=2978127 RepID=UPI0028CA25E8|nr:UDP-N-acetylmuramoyl-L-alanyl-D-glutamate--2,6-diaminopimelate ligase [Aquabacterium sp. OR-4]MDT7837223.1 UDP-N-acetylmuramoyl-L-alanyl-D-glutamate--2,6-diaminopimelate ligase [Aquabacterium sp. OR-4]
MQRLHTPEQAVAWLRAQLALQAGQPSAGATLRTDSRRVQPGDVFIAWPGYASDGRAHVAAALAAGVAACLVEAEGVEAFAQAFSEAISDTVAGAAPAPGQARIAALPGLKAATGAIAAAWFGQPGAALQVVAATGTNGKSSTAWWTAQALSALGRRCGVVGTLGVGEPPLDGALGRIDFTGLTTPDPVTLQATFRQLADQGCSACAIEASSIGIAEHRLAGTPIAVAQFTNFTQDHLDYHGDMAAYWAAKRALFSWPGLRAAAIDVDDAQGASLAAELSGQGGLDVWSCAVQHRNARLRADGLRYVDGGLAFSVVERLADGGEARAELRSGLIGDYNAHNLLVVLAALRALGLGLAEAVAVVPRLTPVPGRMDRVPAAPGQPELVVDYAHTPDALEKAITALRPLAAARGGRLCCVFGCGGDRDASKRPLMGAIAHRLADDVVLTSDNPRTESPGAILSQILAGIADSTAVAVIEDRREAIGHAVRQAGANDVVLIAGKGHEDYQDVAGVKRPFLDAAVAAQALAMRGAA